MAAFSLNEAETNAELIDPILRERGWSIRAGTMRLEQTPGYIYKYQEEWDRGQGRLDYLLCVRPSPDDAPLTRGRHRGQEGELAADLGLEQAKRYARHFNVPFVFSSNGHMYAAYNVKRDYLVAGLMYCCCGMKWGSRPSSYRKKGVERVKPLGVYYCSQRHPELRYADAPRP
jgi:type I site-specific restriction endonuclease